MYENSGGDEIKEDEMVGLCTTYWIDEAYACFGWEPRRLVDQRIKVDITGTTSEGVGSFD